MCEGTALIDHCHCGRTTLVCKLPLIELNLNRMLCEGLSQKPSYGKSV
jgi:hypothetical protein